MRRRSVTRWVAIPLVTIAALLVVGFLVFVPSPREPAYTFITTWGRPGIGAGGFHDPTGIAVADNEVFVADSRNGRIQVFDFSGTFVRAFDMP